VNRGFASQTLRIPTPTSRYTLRSSDPQSWSVRLNGSELAWDQKGDLPRLAGASTAAGDVTFAPATISFLAALEAGNGGCR
jgi:heparanase